MLEQEHLEHDDHAPRRPTPAPSARDHGAEHRDRPDQRAGRCGQTRHRRVVIAALDAEDDAHQERRGAQGEQVDGEAGHDRVAPQVDDHDAEHERHQHRGQTAASTPTSGSPVQAVPTTAAKAPMSIRPSSAMLKMPARSVSSPPRAASRMGDTSRAVDARSATSMTVPRPVISRPQPTADPAPEGDPDRDHQDDGGLDDVHDLDRDLRAALHARGARLRPARKTPDDEGPDGVAAASRAAVNPVHA